MRTETGIVLAADELARQTRRRAPVGQMPGEIESGALRAFCFPHPLRKLFNVQSLTMSGSIGLDIGSDFSHCPSIRKNAWRSKSNAHQRIARLRV
jgi:hypothetical protein